MSYPLIKKVMSGMTRFFSGTFSLIASVASILGLIVIFFTNKNQTIIALVAFVCFLVIILIRLFLVVNTLLLRKHETGFYKFATYVKYVTDDGIHIIYDLHKYIQCKAFSLATYEHDFFWSGNKPPLITSQQQEFIRLVPSTNGGMDKAIFKFKNPLIYNEFCIIHLKMDLDDSEQKSKPFCEQTIRDNVHIVHFRIELRHLESCSDAQLKRRATNSVKDREYEILGYVSFDKSSRSFEHVFFNPQMGYDYRIEWTKPSK